MRDAVKISLALAIFIAGLVLLSSAVLGIVAVYESGNRNTYYDVSEETVVDSISTGYCSGHIDQFTGKYCIGQRTDVIYLSKIDSGEQVEIYPAFVPDGLLDGDTVRLYTPHSRGVFDFKGTDYIIEYNGHFHRSYN